MADGLTSGELLPRGSAESTVTSGIFRSDGGIGLHFSPPSIPALLPVEPSSNIPASLQPSITELNGRFDGIQELVRQSQQVQEDAKADLAKHTADRLAIKEEKRRNSALEKTPTSRATSCAPARRSPMPGVRELASYTDAAESPIGHKHGSPSGAERRRATSSSSSGSDVGGIRIEAGTSRSCKTETGPEVIFRGRQLHKASGTGRTESTRSAQTSSMSRGNSRSKDRGGIKVSQTPIAARDSSQDRQRSVRPVSVSATQGGDVPPQGASGGPSTLSNQPLRKPVSGPRGTPPIVPTYQAWLPKGAVLMYDKRLQDLVYEATYNPQRRDEVFYFFRKQLAGQQYLMRPDFRVLGKYKPEPVIGPDGKKDAARFTFVVTPAADPGRSDQQILQYPHKPLKGPLCSIRITGFTFKKGIYWQNPRARIVLIDSDRKERDIRGEFSREKRLPYEPDAED